jgi:hydrogenase small subunit
VVLIAFVCIGMKNNLNEFNVGSNKDQYPIQDTRRRPMKITRRDFLRYCVSSAATLGLNVSDLIDLREVLANPQGPSVVWLQGSGCTGCSVSFLNRISSASPKSAGEVLINAINLIYHPNLMALAGEAAVNEITKAYNTTGYILAVEGGVPTAYNGNTCWSYSVRGRDWTFREAVLTLINRASKILCIGTCAAWGGVSATPPNPTGVVGVKALTGKSTINIAGCPPHPDWIVWAVAQLLAGQNITLDSNGRPSLLFNRTIHDQCPRRGREKAQQPGQDGYCLKELGCRGPETKGNCPVVRWNNGVSWCVEANAPCLGCTEPNFPGTNSLYKLS